jgi:dienelactone hydrolase
MNQRLSEFGGPRGYDPVPVLSTLRVPSLWLLGGLDESVPTSLTVVNLEQAVADGAPIEIIIYPEGDHGLRRPNSEGRYEIWRYKYWVERYDYWSDVRAWLTVQDILTQP